MKTIVKRMSVLIGVLALGVTAVKAQTDSALLDALVKKGVLSNKEASDIRADEAKDYSKTPASKLAISDYVQKLQFYGDGRLRFDAYGQQFQYPSGGNSVNDRLRYRLRFGLVYTYSPQLSAGFELRSGTADDTANQTMGGMFTDAGINIGKIYVQYKPTDWATLIAGKFTNPIYTTTDEVWSNDLTPEGGAETLSWTIPLGGGSAPVKDAKDMKAVAPAASDSSLTIGLTAAQFYYINNSESATASAIGTSNNNDVWVFENQIPITWKINDNVTAKVVPGFTFYTGGGNMNYDGGVPVNYNNYTPTAYAPTNANTKIPTVPASSAVAAAPATGAVTPGPAPAYVYGTANSSNDPVFYSPNEADDLNIVSAPGEIDYKLFNMPLRTYWDFNWNITAKQRVQNVYLGPGGAYSANNVGAVSPTIVGGYGFAPTGTATGGLTAAATQAAIRKQNQNLADGVAWAIGEQIGQNKKKGDWSLLGEFRQVGLGAVDPNINGTDFANSYANQQGVKIQGVYNFTDYLTTTVTYYNTWDYKNGLYADLNGGNGKAISGTTQYLVGQSSTQRVQVDLGWKF
jgi:hypothetical protein